MSEETNNLFSGASRKPTRSRSYGATSKRQTTAQRKVQKHNVKPTDTLVSLAITYGTTVHELKRLNALWSNECLQLRGSINVPAVSNSNNATGETQLDNASHESMNSNTSNNDNNNDNHKAGAVRPTVTASGSADFSEMGSAEFLRSFDSRLQQLKGQVQSLESATCSSD